MARPEIDLGPTTRRVATDVKRLRELHGLSFAELERRLAEAGRPIPSLGLRNIEAGKRRIDVDELVALAEVLECGPVTLLIGGLDMTDHEFRDAIVEDRPAMVDFLRPEDYEANVERMVERAREALRDRTEWERQRDGGSDRGDG